MKNISLGDAHAKDGFCSSIRQAKIQGEIKDDRFVALFLFDYFICKKEI